MKNHNSLIRQMLIRDGVVLCLFLTGYIGLTCFVINQVLCFISDSPMNTILCTFCTLCVLILGGAMFWIFLYLMKNENEVYGQELEMRQQIREQKVRHTHES